MRTNTRSFIPWAALMALGLACDSSIAPGDEGGPIEGNAGPNIDHEIVGDATLTKVDASDEASWIFLDFESGQQVEVENHGDDASWDLAFQRFHIMSNGGASGSGGVEVAKVEGAGFDEVTSAPAEGWESDAPDGDDDDMLNDFVFGDWYDYNPMTHVLTPAPRVYVVRSVEGQAYKIEIQDYYSETGTSGTPSFLWKAVD